MKKYFLVTTKCGHVGKKFFIPITFPIMAENKKEASTIAREFPRVKRHHWDAILSCSEVTADAYEKQKAINNDDFYLKVRSKQEQKIHMSTISDRLLPDNHVNEIKRNRKSNKPNLHFQQIKYDNYKDSYLCFE